jgi:oxygen-dependent protoporphyrinogen oxidase
MLERFRPRRHDTGDESIDSFVRRRVGGRIAETLGDAFVTGIYAGDPALLSVGACFPRLVEFERDHGSVLRGFAAARRQRRAEATAKGEPPPVGQRMWSFREGLGLLTETLQSRLRRPPLTGVTIHGLRHIPDAKKWHIDDDCQRRIADAVVFACPAYAQAEVLAGFDRELSTLIGGIAYNRLVVVALGYHTSDISMSLDGFGYLTPQRERRDVLGVQWCASIYPGRAPEGMTLLRAMCGGWNRPEMADWDDDRLLAAVKAELAFSMGIRAAPAFVQVVRWERAIPQYFIGHLDRVARIEARAATHAGLYLTGNSYRGVALNDCVEQANTVAERIQKDLG